MSNELIVLQICGDLANFFFKFEDLRILGKLKTCGFLEKLKIWGKSPVLYTTI